MLTVDAEEIMTMKRSGDAWARNAPLFGESTGARCGEIAAVL